MSAKSVLFVDDEPHVLDALRDLLRPALLEAWHPATRRIVLSGHIRADWSTSDAHRAHAVLKKPCDPAALVQAIEGSPPPE
jgi:hypothetical protein